MSVFLWSFGAVFFLLGWGLIGWRVSHTLDFLLRFDDSQPVLPRTERVIVGVLWPVAVLAILLAIASILVMGWLDKK